MATNIAEIELKATDNASAVLTRFTASMDAALKKAEALQLALGRIGSNTQQVAAFEQQIKSLVQQLQQLRSIRVNLSGLGTGGGGGGLAAMLTGAPTAAAAVYLIQKAWEGVTLAIQAAHDMLNAFAERQKTLNLFKFSFGGAELGGREFEYVKKVSDDLGLSLTSTARSYAKLAASSQGTSMAGSQTKDLFAAVAKASTVMGLSAYESEGAIRALGQMMSKGTIMAEELKGQLGERIPGVVPKFAAAMGVSVAELGKLMEAGLNTAENLPKLTKALNDAVGGYVLEASQSLNAELQRMATAWDEIKVAIGAALVEAGAVDIIKSMTDGMKDLAGWIKENEKGLGVYANALTNLVGILGKIAQGWVLIWETSNKAIDVVTGGAMEKAQRSLTVKLRDAEKERAEIGGGIFNEKRRKELDAEIKMLENLVGWEQKGAAAAKVRTAQLDAAEDKQRQQAKEREFGLKAYEALSGVPEKQLKADAAVQKRLDHELKGVEKIVKEYNDYTKTLDYLNASQEKRARIDAVYAKQIAEARKASGKQALEETGYARHLTIELEKQVQQAQAKANAQFFGHKAYPEEIKYLETIAKIEKGISDKKLTGAQAEEATQLALKVKGLERVARLTEEYTKIREKDNQESEKLLQAVERELAAMDDQIDALSMSTDGYNRRAAARAEDRLALMMLTAESETATESDLRAIETQTKYIAKLNERADKQKVLAAVKAREGQGAQAGDDALQAQIKAAEEASKRWKDTADSINNSLTDALMGAFDKGKDFATEFFDMLKNLFKQPLRMIINAAVSPIGNAVSSLMQPVTKGIGDWVGGLFGSSGDKPGEGGGFGMGSIGNIGGILNKVGSWLGFGGAASSLGTGLTASTAAASSLGVGASVGASTLGTGLSTTATGLGLKAGATTAANLGVASVPATAGGMGSMLAAIPVWGWIAAAVLAVVAMGQKPGGPKIGGSFDYDLATGKNTRSYQPSGGDEGKVGAMAESFSKALTTSFEKFGVSTKGLSFTAGYELDPKGTASGHYDVTLMRAGKVLFSQWIETGKDDMEAVAKGLPKLVIDAFKAGVADSDISNVTKALTTTLDTATMSVEDMDATLQLVLDTTDAAVNVFGDKTGWISEQAVKAAGGLQGFGTGLTALADGQTVFAAAMAKEKQARDALTKSFTDLGQAAPTSLAGLREMVTSITDLQDPTGELRGKLIALAPAMQNVDNILSSLVSGVTGWDAAGTGKALFDAVFSASNAEEAGKNFQQAFQKSFADTMGGYITQQVGQMVFQGIITPMIQAALQQATLVQSGGATAGVAMSTGGSIAGGAIAEAVGKITTFLGAMKQVLNDPTVQAAFKEIGASLAGVGSDVYNMASGTGLLQPAFTAQTTTATGTGESGGGSNETAKKDAEDLAKFMADINRSMRDMGASDFDKTMSNLADEYAANTARAKELADTTEELARLTDDLDTITALYTRQVEEAKRVEAERLKAIELETRKTIVSATVAVIQGLQEIGKGVKSFIDSIDADLLTLNKANPAFDAAGEVSGRIAGLWKDLTATRALDQTNPEVGQEQLRLAEKLRAAVMERYNVELDAARNATDASKKQLDVAISLRDYLNKLKLGELSTLDPGQKVAEGKRQFDELLSRARAGDVTAQGKLGDTADSYLKAASDYFASSVGYAQIFDTVTGALGEFTQPGKSTEELLSELNDLETDYNAKALAAADKARLELEKLRKAAGDKLDGLNFNIQDIANQMNKYLGQDSAMYAAITQTLPAEIAKLLGIQGYTPATVQSTAVAPSPLGSNTVAPSIVPSVSGYVDQAATGDIFGAITGARFAGFTAQQMADAWNTAHPDQLTTAQAIQDFATANGINGFAFGARDVAADQLAMVHRGEMIFDQATANALRKYGIKTEPTETGLTREDIDAIAAEGRAQVRQNAEAYPAIIEELRAMRMELAELKSQARLASAE